MQLVLLVTARCNASCAHCSTSCGPHRTEHLPAEVIMRSIDEAAALSVNEPLEISISGGEPFLDFTLLKDVISHGFGHGAYMTCVSNGYWATSPARAATLLRELKDAGLALLAISTSKFHEEFISRKRVDCAINAAREVGLECVLKVVRSADDAELGDVSARAKLAGVRRTETIRLVPSVRQGAAIPETDFVRETALPSGTCPAAVITVAETGHAYMCCSPGAFNDFLRLGNVIEQGLGVVRENFYLGAKQQILRRFGPRYFAKAIKQCGAKQRLRSSYGNVCDLCTHIAKDPEMASIADGAARAFALQQLEASLSEVMEEPQHDARTSHETA